MPNDVSDFLLVRLHIPNKTSAVRNAYAIAGNVRWDDEVWSVYVLLEEPMRDRHEVTGKLQFLSLEAPIVSITQQPAFPLFIGDTETGVLFCVPPPSCQAGGDVVQYGARAGGWRTLARHRQVRVHSH